MSIEEYMLQDPKRIESVKARLQSKLKLNTESGCIEWSARARANGGYGTLCVGRRGHIRAHRAAWALANGPIPKGMYVCHSCDNPLCCNVAHLFLGTPKENMADKEAKGRGTKPPVHYGERHHNTTLTAEQVLEIRGTDGRAEDVSAKYGVSSMTIRRIRKGRTWRKLIKPPST